MITVELQQPQTGSIGYTTAATITVDDGQVTVTGDHELVDLDLRVMLVDGRVVTGRTNPAEWARHLGNALRTGYLVPVVTVDDDREAPATGGRTAADELDIVFEAGIRCAVCGDELGVGEEARHTDDGLAHPDCAVDAGA